MKKVCKNIGVVSNPRTIKETHLHFSAVCLWLGLHIRMITTRHEFQVDRISHSESTGCFSFKSQHKQ